MWIIIKEFLVGSACDSVGREVAKNTKDPRFESSHRRNFINLFSINCIEKTKNKEKEAGNGTFLKRRPRPGLTQIDHDGLSTGPPLPDFRYILRNLRKPFSKEWFSFVCLLAPPAACRQVKQKPIYSSPPESHSLSSYSWSKISIPNNCS